jgi:energy-coupling factor transport system permease protein
VSRSLISLSVGHYLPGDTLVHRTDARLKLVGAVVFAISLFAVEGWKGLGVLALSLAVGFALAGVPPGYLWRGLRPLTFLLVLTFVLQLFSYPGTPLLQLGPLTISREGLDQAAFLTIRLGMLLLSSTLLTLTTAPVAVTDGLEWLLAPLKRVRVPSHEIAMMMTIALRFIPTLTRELDELIKAQRARGVEFKVRDPRRFVQALLPLAVPLFVLSFRRADDLAVAMTSRCYRGGEGRTRYRELRLGRLDVVAGALGVAIVVLAVSVGRWWG